MLLRCTPEAGLASPVSANIITKTNDVVNQKSLEITDVEDNERTLAAANDENHLIIKTLKEQFKDKKTFSRTQLKVRGVEPDMV